MPNHVQGSTPWEAGRPVWALKGNSGPYATLGRPSAAQRKGRTWDTRHHKTFPNDFQHPNGRDYFDRYRDKGDLPQVPRQRLRPVWTLECPNVEANKHTYQVFDAATAQMKEKIWQIDESGKTLGGEEGAPRRTRTPRSGTDLKEQRSQEKEWDRGHGIVFSRANSGVQVNYRSYFDRWKEDEGSAKPSLGETRLPTWKLGVEKRVFLKTSNSEPALMDRDLLRKEKNFSTRCCVQVCALKDRC